MGQIGLISIVVVLLDRIIKLLVDKFLILNIKNVVIDNFLYITKCYNEGAAFNIFSGNLIFLILATIFALFMLLKYIKNDKKPNKISIISYGLLIGGIIGNLVDRIFLGYVIDYLNFIIFNHEFAIFNLADICIVIGAILLLLSDWGDNSDTKNSDSS